MSDGAKISVSTTDLGQLVIRLGIGFVFAFHHGWHKVLAGPKMWEKLGGVMGHLGITFWPTFWGFMATVGEFGGGILILLGVFFRLGCSMLTFVMVMATIQTLNNPMPPMGPLDAATAPILAAAAILGLLLMGPGKISLKHAIGPLRSRWYG